MSQEEPFGPLVVWLGSGDCNVSGRVFECAGGLISLADGWQVGADAGVTLLTVGANARVDTRNAQQPVVAFVMSNAGLMANLSLDGSRVTRLDI